VIFFGKYSEQFGINYGIRVGTKSIVRAESAKYFTSENPNRDSATTLFLHPYVFFQALRRRSFSIGGSRGGGNPALNRMTVKNKTIFRAVSGCLTLNRFPYSTSHRSLFGFRLPFLPTTTKSSLTNQNLHQ
jgi:hypothetical protein